METQQAGGERVEALLSGCFGRESQRETLNPRLLFIPTAVRGVLEVVGDVPAVRVLNAGQSVPAGGGVVKSYIHPPPLTLIPNHFTFQKTMVVQFAFLGHFVVWWWVFFFFLPTTHFFPVHVGINSSPLNPEEGGDNQCLDFT